MFEGIVIKSTGSWFTVMQNDGSKINCKLKGQFRIKGIKTTNPVAVGDKVEFIHVRDESTGLITRIFERKNHIIRRSTKLSAQSHIIASNIDQAVLIVTHAQPRTSTGFIDRFLVTAEAYHIPAVLLINKIDLFNEELKNYHDKIIQIYSSVGYPCYSVSALKGTNLTQLKNLLKDKISLLSGHSGVGKSALVNAIEPGLDIKTGEISHVHNKGKHTTAHAEMHKLSFGGFIIDTPGIKEFGLLDFDKNEVAERFPEMREKMHDCKFNNCTHVHEPDCAVKKAVEDGTINKSRYLNYLSILNDKYFEIVDWEK
ncbi:MAG: ribosome small subunit-dependent GTPase A [Bacteroidales bacterium]|nr:ribosome small subunit-dependent GTPase A [Bacteroidales bacterium]